MLALLAQLQPVILVLQLFVFVDVIIYSRRRFTIFVHVGADASQVVSGLVHLLIALAPQRLVLVKNCLQLRSFLGAGYLVALKQIYALFQFLPLSIKTMK